MRGYYNYCWQNKLVSTFLIKKGGRGFKKVVSGVFMHKPVLRKGHRMTVATTSVVVGQQTFSPEVGEFLRRFNTVPWAPPPKVQLVVAGYFQKYGKRISSRKMRALLDAVWEMPAQNDEGEPKASSTHGRGKKKGDRLPHMRRPQAVHDRR